MMNSKTFFSLVFLILGNLNLSAGIVLEQENSDSDESRWLYTFQFGWATNIDFAVKSTSAYFMFDNYSTGVKGEFNAYDSRKSFTELEGDQANNYLLSIRNNKTGLTVTTGIIHDKRKQIPNISGNRFRYLKGGMSPTLMIGYEHKFVRGFWQNLRLQVRAGPFFNYNKISVKLTDFESNISYLTTNKKRALAGKGFIGMAVLSYDICINKSWGLCLLINSTVMTGNASTNVIALDNETSEISEGNLSIKYASISIGPSLGLTFKR